MKSGRTIVHWACVGGHLDALNLATNYFNVPLDEQDEVVLLLYNYENY